MKILLVITQGNTGGAQMSVLNLARQLIAQGHQVVVGIGPYGDFLPSSLSELKIQTRRFRWLSRSHSPLLNLAFILEIISFVKKQGFDAVHLNSSNALCGAVGVKLANPKIKTVFTFRGLSLLDPNYECSRWKKKLYQCYFNIFLKYIDHKVFVSHENQQRLQQLVPNSLVIHNGLNPDTLVFLDRTTAQVEMQDFASTTMKDFVMGSIGRAAYQKNYLFLIKIFPKILALCPQAKLIIFGGGELLAELRQNISQAQLEKHIFLAGDVPNAYRFLKALDLFLLPSRYEGLSITLIETTMAGLPTLVSDVGGNRETLQDEQQLYDLNNETEFLTKLQQLLPLEIRSSIARNNLKRSEYFHIKKTASAYERLYGYS